MKKGKFIVFEGIDGCGKTTQAKRLQEYFGNNAIFTREPYRDGPVCSDIRNVLMKDYKGQMAPLTELFLFEAARAQHVKDIIMPALNKDKIVICDRFTGSSIAYQGYGRGIDIKTVETANNLAINNLIPDITFWIDTPVEEAIKRSHQIDDVNIRDDETKEFYEKCRDYYYKKSLTDKNFIRIDGMLDIDTVFKQILFEISL